MNLEIGTEAVQFPEKEHINGIFIAVRGSVWLLPVIFLLLTNTVSWVQAFLSIWLERFRVGQKDDERGPLSTVYHSFILRRSDSSVLMHGSRRFFLVLFSTGWFYWFWLVLDGFGWFWSVLVTLHGVGRLSIPFNCLNRPLMVSDSSGIALWFVGVREGVWFWLESAHLGRTMHHPGSPPVRPIWCIHPPSDWLLLLFLLLYSMRRILLLRQNVISHNYYKYTVKKSAVILTFWQNWA
jgi:hypothetical protein